MSITLSPITRRDREDVRVDAFVRAIRRSADCTAVCEHQPERHVHQEWTECTHRAPQCCAACHVDVDEDPSTAELPAIVATASVPLTQPAVVEQAGSRTLAVLVLAGILVSVILALLLMPVPHAAAAETSAELGPGLQFLIHMDEVVAVTAHAITPR